MKPVSDDEKQDIRDCVVRDILSFMSSPDHMTFARSVAAHLIHDHGATDDEAAATVRQIAFEALHLVAEQMSLPPDTPPDRRADRHLTISLLFINRPGTC